MAKRALHLAILAATLGLLLVCPVVFAQNSVSDSIKIVSGAPGANSGGAPEASQTTGRSSLGQAAAVPQGASRGRDPETTAIFQAEREGRLAEAENLLTAAIQKAESVPGSETRLSLLFKHLASLNMRQGRHDDAVAAAERALAIDKKLYGPESPAIARDLNNLAVTRQAVRKTLEDATAEQEYKQALAIAQLNQSAQPGILLMVLNNLSQFYLRRKRASEAEALINEAMQVCQNNSGPKPFQCASFRNLLALTYRQEGHANAAEEMSFESVASDAASNHPVLEKLMNLETLARQYETDGTYGLAETTFRQALALAEANAKPDEPAELPNVMDSLGEVLVKEGQNAEAEDLFKRALDLQEKAARIRRPQFPLWLNFSGLLNLYRTEGRLEDIEPVIQQGIAIQEQASDAGMEPLAESLMTLAGVYEEEKKYSDAEPVCARALKIQEANYGTESPRLLSTIETCARVLRHVGKTSEANALQSRATKIHEKYFVREQN